MGERLYFVVAGGINKGEKLPSVDRFPRRLQLRIERVGKRQVHIVASQKDMFADTDAFHFEISLFFGDCNETEIRGTPSDVTDQDDIPGADLVSPIVPGLRHPRIKGCLRLFQEDDFAKARGLCGLSS